MISHRNATHQELVDHLTERHSSTHRVKFRHFVTEYDDPRMEHEVRHRQYVTAAWRIIDGIAHVAGGRYRGEPLTADVAVLETGRNVIIDVRLAALPGNQGATQ